MSCCSEALKLAIDHDRESVTKRFTLFHGMRSQNDTLTCGLDLLDDFPKIPSCNRINSWNTVAKNIIRILRGTMKLCKNLYVTTQMFDFYMLKKGHDESLKQSKLLGSSVISKICYFHFWHYWPVLGSSRNMIGGSATKDMATFNFLLLPPL